MYNFKYYTYSIIYKKTLYKREIIFDEMNHSYFLFTYDEYKMHGATRHNYGRRGKNYMIHCVEYPKNSNVFMYKF